MSVLGVAGPSICSPDPSPLASASHPAALGLHLAGQLCDPNPPPAILMALKPPGLSSRCRPPRKDVPSQRPGAPTLPCSLCTSQASPGTQRMPLTAHPGPRGSLPARGHSICKTPAPPHPSRVGSGGPSSSPLSSPALSELPFPPRRTPLSSTDTENQLESAALCRPRASAPDSTGEAHAPRPPLPT